VQQLGYQRKFGNDPVPQRALWDVAEVAAQVAH
jgi:hypothetical protein